MNAPLFEESDAGDGNSLILKVGDVDCTYTVPHIEMKPVMLRTATLCCVAHQLDAEGHPVNALAN